MADYYILNQKSLTLFLPFLHPDDQQGATCGELRVVGAVEEQTAVGAAVFSRVGEDAFLRGIAVSPAYQHQGIAEGMLRYLCSVLPALDCFSLTVSVAPNHPAEPIIAKLMQKLGGEITDGPSLISCPIAALRESPLLKPLLTAESGKVVSMKDMSGMDLREFGNDLLHKGVISVPMDWETFDPQLSFFGMTEKREISCCVCAVQSGDGISVEWIYTEPSAARELVMAVVALLRRCETVCPPDACFSAVLIDDSARKLLERLGGDRVKYQAAGQWKIAL